MANRWLWLTLGLCAWSLVPLTAAAQADNVQLLIDKLERGDSFRVRTQAAAVLGRLNDPRAVDPLIRCLREDDSYAVRGAAAAALGHVGGATAVDSLFTALSDDDSFVRSLAENALLEMSGPGVADALRGHMFDGASKERTIAFRRLLKLAEASDSAAIAILVDALAIKEFRGDSEQLLGRLPGERVVPLLLPALKADDAEMRMTAVRLLMLHPSPQVVDALGAAYSRAAEEESVRSEVKRALVAMANFVDVAGLV
ncbi:MAG: HEAT repeat domain-containing protein, partial [Deltaproteobacteria bacterium]|nr:HEAT repeat domain-containing protein [Deltaproteobacteria bacterium]